MKNLRHFAILAASIVPATFALPILVHAQDVITTFAGGGPNGIPALNANLNSPLQLAIDAQGSIYFPDYLQNRVFKINTSGIISVVAGTGFAGYSGDGGLATAAELNSPNGVAVDGANPANVFIADTTNCVVRKVDQSTGTISTIAGKPPCSYSGDGGAADAAQLNQPIAVTIDPNSGDLYITDFNNGRIRKVAGGTATGTITTVAGGGGSSTSPNNCLGSAPYGDGGAATAAYLCYPRYVTLDTSTSPLNLFVTEANNYRCTMREVVGSSEKIYQIAGTYNTCGFKDNVVATSGELYNPQQPAVTVSGAVTTVTVPDYSNNRVRQFTLSYSGGAPQPGTITTIAGNGSASFCGDGGAAKSACLDGPSGAVFDGSGNLFITDQSDNHVRKITKSTGDISTVAGWGNVNYSDPVGISDVPAAGLSLYLPAGVFADRDDDEVYIGGDVGQADYVSHSTSGLASVFAGNGVSGYAGEGSAASGPGTELNYPDQLTKDSSGNVYLADTNNCVIREIVASTGDIETVAGSPDACGYGGDGGPATKANLYYPHSVTVDADDNLYIADYSNCRIRKVASATGTITTAAGNGTCGYYGDNLAATKAELSQPQDVAVDALGDLFIADGTNNRIRRVDGSTGIITTIAGTGVAGYNGDGPASGVDLYNPTGASIDPNGNLFITDYSNNLVRWMDPAGTLVTFAGSPAGSPQGSYGFGGDNGLATIALLANPARTSQDGNGNFYIADQNNNRIRKVSAFAGYGRSTASLDFGEEQQVGTTSGYEPIFLSAIGPVTVSSITTTASFSEIDDCSGNALTAGETCEIDVYFTPAKGGVTTGKLTIASNAYFKGTGGLSAQGNTVALSGSAVGLTASGSLNNFPTQLVKQSSTQTVSITNSGALVKLTGLSIPGTTNFTVSGGTCAVGKTLATGASCTVSVTFDPTSTGTKEHSLAVASTDPASPLLVSVKGTGTQLTLSPTSLAFGTVSSGTTKALNLTVTNSNGSYTIAPTISGTGFTILTTGNTCTAAIPAGGSCTLPIQFAPTSGASYAGTLTLAPAAGSASPTVALSGTGQAGTTTALASSLNPSTSGQAVTFTATVTASSGATPTGTVGFYSGSGSTLMGTETLSGGVATYTTSSLSVATHHIVAKYTGSGTDAASESTAVVQVVNE